MLVVLNTTKQTKLANKHCIQRALRISGTVRNFAQFPEVKQRQRGHITLSRLYASPTAFDAVRNTWCYARLQYAKHVSKRKNECQCICVKPQERVLAMNVNARQNCARLWGKSFSRITEMGKMPRVWIERERDCFLSKFTFSLPLSYYRRWKSQFKKCVWCVHACPQGGRG